MRLLLLFLLGLPMPGAILRGYAVEHATGKALARTLVAIQPLPGTSGPTLSVRTNSYGVFEFLNLPAGAYLLNASRRGFAPVHYGQKRWNAPGTPVIVDPDQAVTVQIRLPRYGAITGFVVDENDVGIPEHEVLAYRNTRPPKVVAKFPTDDRGWFRVWGLEPGSYLIRTAARKYEDGDYLPTFFRETLRVEEASPVLVRLDDDASDVRVRPFPGKLLNIAGQVRTCYEGQMATVTLVSDMGRETINTGGSFSFNSKPPGNYEIFAETPADRQRQACGAYTPFSVENRDYMGLNVPLVRLPDLVVGFEGINGLDAGGVPVQVRRKDLAGESELQPLRLVNGVAHLNPGRWELRLQPSPSYVATDFRANRGEVVESGRADGWVEIMVRGFAGVIWTLSDKPASIHGVVTGPGHEPVPGAPVLIEAWDPVNNKRILDLRTVRADMRGRFQVFGLAPGTWRLLSTLDVEDPDAAEMEQLLPKSLKVEAGRDYSMDLDLSVLR
jgi:Carboxypeptidase regulatory-like domain